jgi:tetratricopeptide (TPR) repeat protein
VARGTQHRKRRTPTNARVEAPPAKEKPKKRVKHERWEDQLFFSRLRVHAKWMFVLLALVFGVGFVIFGVGSGSTGISDVLQNFFSGSSSNGPSASSLRKQAEQHPNEPKRWRDLATKLEADNKLDEAVVALKRYTELRPKDDSALGELASVYLRRATSEQQAYISARTRSSVLSPTPPAPPPATSTLGKALSTVANPVQSAVASVIGSQTNTAYNKILDSETEAVATYQKIADLNPKDATTQLRLAQVAQSVGDAVVAEKAYKRFLELAPDDPLAASAKKALKALQKSTTATGAGTHK